MGSHDDGRLVGKHGTDIPSMLAVRGEVTRLVNQKWGGWPTAEREDLESIVLEKYFVKFGRDRLPDGDDGEPRVPSGWLRTVIANSGIDAHRKTQARPADAFDFNDDRPDVAERLFAAVAGQPSLGTLVTTRIAIHRALRTLTQSHPNDAELIYWSVIHDLPLAEVAMRAGRSPEATKKGVQRALARLRAVLEPELLAEEPPIR